MKQFFAPSGNYAVVAVFWTLALLHLFIPFYNHAVFRTFGYDYAVYNFAFYDYAHLRASACPLYMNPEPVSFWQDHFSLLLPLLSPLYWIMRPLAGSYSLIILQWFFIVAGGVCTYRFIRRKVHSDLVPLMAVACYFLLHGRFTSHRADVNLAIMGASIVPIVVCLFDAGRWRAMWVAVLILIVTREDLSLWLSFVALTLAIVYRKQPAFRKQAVAVALVSIVYFIVCMTIFIPLFLENEHKKFTLFEYSALGTDFGSALRYVAHDPLQVFKMLFINHSGNGYYDNVKRDFYIIYLLSGGVLVFMRPALLIAFLPLLAKKMLNDNPVRWGLDSYYAIEFVSILPLLVYFVISGWRSQKTQNAAAAAVAVLTALTTIYVMNFPPDSYRSPGEEKYNFLSGEFYRQGEDPGEIGKVLATIPDDAEVSASGALTTHLAFRRRILYFPVKTDTSYVAVLRSTSTYPLSQDHYHHEIARLLSEPEKWQILYESPKIILFRGIQAPGRPG